MTVGKYKSGYTVKHCHGKDKGKPIDKNPKPVSRKKALKRHRAIMRNK